MASANSNANAAAGAAAASTAVVAQSTWIEATVDMGHALRPSPPVSVLQEIKKHQQWANDEYVLRMARQKYGDFTSTIATGSARSGQCRAEDFDCVYEPLGVFACLRHMVVHRCGESWQQVKGWIDLPDGASSLLCRKILVGGSKEANWCCAFSRKLLPDAAALSMTTSPVKTLSDLGAVVYGKGRRDDDPYRGGLIGGTLRRSGSQKRSYDDAFHSCTKRHDLLKQTIDAMVKALVDPQKRAEYNDMIRQRAGKCEPLHLKKFAPSVQLLLRSRLLALCGRLLQESDMKVDKKDMNSLVFFALNITVEGPRLGSDVIAPRLPVRWLRPLPIETIFERAFGLPLSQYSKMATRIQRLTGDSRFAQDAGWCVSPDEGDTKYVSSSVSLSPSSDFPTEPELTGSSSCPASSCSES